MSDAIARGTEVHVAMEKATQFVGDNLGALCKELDFLQNNGVVPTLNNRQPKIHQLADMLKPVTRGTHQLARVLIEAAAVRFVGAQHG